jgi:septal ring factor EnvC (AmiA/AmiB activator)
MRDIVKKILQVLKEDQSLDFGPRLKSSVVNKKTIQDAIKSKRQLIKKSQETYADLERKLHDLKKANDNIREELLESLGSEL